MSSFRRCTVEDIAAPARNALVGGPFGSDLVGKDYVETGIPVIRGQNMGKGRWVEGEFAFVSEEKAAKLSANTARPMDLVFTQRGTLGQVALVPPAPYDRYVISQSQMKLTVDETKAVPEFVYYVFTAPLMVDYILNHAIQTGVPHTNLGILRRTPLKLPSLEEQRAIVRVLGALDDKIELNRRTNRTLEEIARAIITSWFVDFDPVWAKAEGRQPVGMDAETAAHFPDSFEASDLGPLPAGWRVGSLSDIALNPRRGIQPEAIRPATPYIALDHMPRRSIALEDWDVSATVTSNKFVFRRGEILFGKLRPYFHKVGVAPIDGVCSTDILVIVPRMPEWLGILLGHVSSDKLIEFTDLGSTGTKMPRTNWSDIGSYKIAIPPGRAAEAATRMILPMVERIVSNIHENRTLMALRDALLPKLMSGELSPMRGERANGK